MVHGAGPVRSRLSTGPSPAVHSDRPSGPHPVPSCVHRMTGPIGSDAPKMSQGTGRTSWRTVTVTAGARGARVSERVVELPSQVGRPSPEFERTPPQDIAAEQSVLGGMLLSQGRDRRRRRGRAGDRLLPAGPPDDLRRRRRPLRQGRAGRPDHRLGRADRGSARSAGSAARPTCTRCCPACPTAANAGFYARIVAEQAILRRLVEAGTRIVQLGYGAAGAGDVDDVVDRAQQADLRRHRAPDQRGLHAARASCMQPHDGRDRGDRQPRRLDVRRPDRLRRPRRAHQRPAPRAAHRHRRPARARASRPWASTSPARRRVKNGLPQRDLLARDEQDRDHHAPALGRGAGRRCTTCAPAR